MEEVKELIIEEVNKWTLKAEEIYEEELGIIKVKFSLRGGVIGTGTGHLYNPNKREVNFNMTALNVEGGKEELIHNTIPHEVAHVVQYSLKTFNRCDNKYHGWQWREVMKTFGFHNPSVTHDLKLPRARKVELFDYVCTGCGIEISLGRKRHTKFMVAQTFGRKTPYWCAKCKGAIKWLKTSSIR